METANNNWKFNCTQYGMRKGESELAKLFEDAREKVPFHTGSVTSISIIIIGELITISCNWKFKDYTLKISVILKGQWRRGMQQPLITYFFDGTFNGNEGFGKIQGFTIQEVEFTLAHTQNQLRNNDFNEFVYFLEKKRK